MTTSEEKPYEGRLKRRRLKVGDPDFKPPDGGWGWLIIFACGFSNLSNFPMFQQFGLIFRTKFEELGISNTETTTVINLNSAFNTGVGLLNGPIFKKFTYRQVAMFGSCLVGISLFCCIFCESFWAYIIFYSLFYGSGIGITQSSNALALNTYFKDKRRIATGLSWSTTALGPIVWPYIVTASLDEYGNKGTLLIFAGIAWHSFMCSLLLQPVEWHTKFREIDENSAGTQLMLNDSERVDISETPQKNNSAKKSKKIFSSQYLNNEDDPISPGYEITDPGTPMMVRANDGYFSLSKSQRGSRLSLISNKSRGGSKVPSGQNSTAISTRPSTNNLLDSRSGKSSRVASTNNVLELKSNRNSYTNVSQSAKERKRERKISKNERVIQEEEEAVHENGTHKTHLTVPEQYTNEKETLKEAAMKLEEYEQSIKEAELVKKIIEEEERRKAEELEHKDHLVHIKPTLWQKIYLFFDFDLFKDPIYVNLMLGITIANFAEINFSILTPMVLNEFGYAKYEIATFMSLLGVTDILVRFFVPFIADRIGWDNKTFFLVGVMSMAMGRIILVHFQSYNVGLFVAIVIGAGKGLRTIFMALVIPGHVSLEKLPAASGLQLATSGLLFVILGPVVGWIQEMTQTYVLTLHILNICTYITAVSWTVERIISSRKRTNVNNGKV